jgi:hypothetical protein
VVIVDVLPIAGLGGAQCSVEVRCVSPLPSIWLAEQSIVRFLADRSDQ